MEILNIISKKLQIFKIDLPTESMKEIVLEVDQAIKNYCKIDEIPEELLYVRANLCIDYIRYQQSSIPLEPGQLDTQQTQKVGPLTLVSSGDVTYQFGSVQASKSNLCNGHLADLDSFLLNYEKQLSPFKRLVW